MKQHREQLSARNPNSNDAAAIASPARPRDRKPAWLAVACVGTALAGALALTLGGCAAKPKTIKPVERYPSLGPKQYVPDFMKGTIWERCEIDNSTDFRVSSYGLVVNLRGTGDCTAPTLVRDFIVKEMLAAGFSSAQQGTQEFQPERILNDPRAAIVLVSATMPPGVRKGQRFDAQVQALPGNSTTSLACGLLYRAQLGPNGATAMGLGSGAVHEFARAEGQIFVNPAYALTGSATQPTARASLRFGTIPDGAVAMEDQPLALRIRQPQWSLARLIEERMNQRFQAIADRPSEVNLNDYVVAQAQDDAYVGVYVPKTYNGDWRRFVGVATHLYINGSPIYLLNRAQQLAADAVKPNAPLQDIVYCFEGIGKPALPYIAPLLSSASPAVQFAAAEASAFLGDQAGEEMLMAIAKTPHGQFQLNAIRTLGQLPSTGEISDALSALLDCDDAVVRVAAYQVLAKNSDPRIFTTSINDEFLLDIVQTKGPPLVYASRSGVPRIAIFGDHLALRMPITFTAFHDHLSITSALHQPRLLTIFDRTVETRPARSVISGPDLAEIVSRLGGEGVTSDGDDPSGSQVAPPLDMAYGDIVAVVEGLAEQKMLYLPYANQLGPATFVLQEPPAVEREIEGATPVRDQMRPQGGSTGASDVQIPFRAATQNSSADVEVRK